MRDWCQRAVRDVMAATALSLWGIPVSHRNAYLSTSFSQDIGVEHEGAGLLSSKVPAQDVFERRQKPLLSHWSAGMLVIPQDFDVLFANQRCEKTAPVKPTNSRQ